MVGRGLATNLVPPHPASKQTSSGNINMRRFRFSPLEITEIVSANGKSPRARKGAWSLLTFPLPGKDGAEIADPVVEMTTVAVTGVLPSRVPVSGVTVHVLPAGEPAQIVMIGPVSPLTGVRVTWVVKV